MPLKGRVLRVLTAVLSRALYDCCAIPFTPMPGKCGELLHPFFPQPTNVHPRSGGNAAPSLFDGIDRLGAPELAFKSARGSRKGSGNAVRYRGCPRNCDRRAVVRKATEAKVLGRRTRAKTRKPGNLTRAVVLFPAGVRRGLRGKPSRRHVESSSRGLGHDFLSTASGVRRAPASGTQTRRSSCASFFFPPCSFSR
jgi:hypothetical protein